MIETLTFLNEAQFWLIVAGISVTGCVFIWKEWQHFGTSRFWLKISLIIIALLALMLMALQPALMVNKKSKNLIIVTQNYKANQLDSLKIRHKKVKPLKYVPNSSIFEANAAIDSVFILGQGIEPYDLWQLKDKTVVYLGNYLPSGIIKYHYKSKNREGEALEFKGVYEQPKNGRHLILQGPGKRRLDSVKLKTLDKQSFQLATPLKAAGKYVYKLIEEDSNGQLIALNPIPVEVIKRDVLKIMLINEFPSFESKYLKNYLAEKGHEVLVRSKITKARYKYEYFNTKKRSIGGFTTSNLKDYDLIIIDANALKNLDKASNKALENAVSDVGLGVLIQANPSFFRTSNRLARFDFKQDNKTSTALKNASKIRIEKQPYRFNNEFTLETLLQSDANHILAAYKQLGNGRVGTTVLGNTYALVLKGQTEQYAKLWTRIIEGLSKRVNPKINWVSTINLATVDIPFPFKLRTLTAKIPEVKTDQNYRIALKNTIDLPKVWQGVTYPLTSGWHTLKEKQDSSLVFNYYVQDTLAWRAKAVYDKIVENKRFYNNANPKKTPLYSLKTINPLWFFSLFLISMGLLWLLPKLT